MYQSWSKVIGRTQMTGPGFLVPAAGAPSWVKGFNFRSTSTFVTDGTDETYVLAADSYPTTRNGVTFGWDGFIGGAADRDSGLDRRLAGVNFRTNSSAQAAFRVDLPASGSYTIRLALGDGGSAQAYQYLQLKDNTTVLLTIDDTDGTLLATFDDATGANYSAANWPGSNSSVTHSFSTTTLLLVIGSPIAQSGSSTIAHLLITQN